MENVIQRLLMVLTLVLLTGFMASSAFAQVNTATETPTSTFCAGCSFTSTPTLTPSNTPAANTSTPTGTSTSTPIATATLTATATPTYTSTTTFSNTPTNTATLTFTLTPTPTPSGTPTVTATPTATSLFSPTPTPPFTAGDCSTIETYAYPDPVPGNSMKFLFVLCEAGSVKIRVYNPAVGLAAFYSTTGSPGPNVYPVDASVFSHGVYYYFVQSSGPSGDRRSKPTKFAVTRSP